MKTDNYLKFNKLTIKVLYDKKIRRQNLGISTGNV